MGGVSVCGVCLSDPRWCTPTGTFQEFDVVVYTPSTGEVVLVVECKLNPAHCLLADTRKLRSALDKLTGQVVVCGGQKLRFESPEVLHVGRGAFNAEAFALTAKWTYFGRCIEEHRFGELQCVRGERPYLVLHVPQAAVQGLAAALPSPVMSIVGGVSSVELESDAIGWGTGELPMRKEGLGGDT